MIAWRLYADDFNGRLPFNTVFERDLTRSWCTGSMSYNTSNPDNTNRLLFTRALMGPYFGSSGEIFKGPGDRTVNPPGRTPRVRSIAMNAFVGGFWDGTSWSHIADRKGTWREYRNIDQFDDPANRWVFTDECPTLSDGFLVHLMPVGTPLHRPGFHRAGEDPVLVSVGRIGFGLGGGRREPGGAVWEAAAGGVPVPGDCVQQRRRLG